MSAELTFRDVSYPGFFDGFSCEIQAGCSALIVTARETESTLLTRLITGLSYPSQGSVLVDNREVAKLAADQLYQFRRDTGIVPSNGGLISNLKAWENITLPLLYHTGAVTAKEEELATAYLATLGYSGNVMALPAHLSLHEKQCIAVVRTLITNPRIIIYSNCFESVPSDQMAAFSRLTAEFHAASNDRISLYLASSSDMAACLTVDRIIHLHEPPETTSRNS